MTSPESPLCCFRFSSPSTPTPSAEDRGGGARRELLLKLRGGHAHKFVHPRGTQVLQDPFCLSLNVSTSVCLGHPPASTTGSMHVPCTVPWCECAIVHGGGCVAQDSFTITSGSLLEI